MLRPAELAARVLYRDPNVLILDKPHGLPVHAGPKGGPHLGHYLSALTFGLPKPPALAHRLDRETSGCLVLGRHKQALVRLHALFEAGRVEKTYWAITVGAPAEDAGTIDLKLAKKSPERGWHMKVDAAGQEAVTRFRVLGRGDGIAWLELMPKTGRTHQLRVHCAGMGWPILGDRIYGKGSAAEAGGKLHLLARAIALPYFPARPRIEAQAPVPEHMKAMLAACGAMI